MLTQEQERILSIFNEWFGEDRVDVSSNEPEGLMHLFVWYPDADITNEHGDTHHIKDLYFRFVVFANGKLLSKPMAFRTTFTQQEYIAKYYHSHVNSRYNTFGKWCEICTGTSPFSDALTLLMTSSEDLDTWEFIPGHLDDFVKTESLRGGPWIRMSAISNETREFVSHSWESGDSFTDLSSIQLFVTYRFLDYLISNNGCGIKLSCIGSKLEFVEKGLTLLKSLSRVYLNFIKAYYRFEDITNAKDTDVNVIRQYDSDTSSLFVPVYNRGDKLYYVSAAYSYDGESNPDFIDFTFKGETKRLTIYSDGTVSPKAYYILKPGYAKYLINCLTALFAAVIPNNYDFSKPLIYD